ncbi:MAG: site-specific integrase [Lachnospiraceae bacterium]|nr:site-specific integrase [Lachnospiraceae bacterium]
MNRATQDPKTGKWMIQYRYTDWQGKRRKSTKRGFKTKREAEKWLREFLTVSERDFDMKFQSLVDLYLEDMHTRIRESTMRTKRYIIDLKLLPYFGQRKVNEIKAADIRAWQNELMKQGYSQTYLRMINNQLSAIFNYAVQYYDLKNNPCRKAGTIGKSKAEEMNFWTKEEFTLFLDAVIDKQQSYVAFEVLYWTGIRVGELLALTPKDIDIDRKMLRINKSYQRLNRKDVITPPKTPKSNRCIKIPDFLLKDLLDYRERLYGLQEEDRLFSFSKSYLESEMSRGIRASGVKRIRLHDLRHSAASMLVELGFSPLEIAERLGHEKIETTLNTYSHLYPDKQDRLAARLEEEHRRSFE